MAILKKIKLPGLIALLTIGLLLAQRVVAQPGVSVPVESFYNELAPYGQWTQHPGYGNVWMPNAGPDFQPYATGGHWVMTEFGNTWVSDYAWGWAPFHYGRWIFDQAYGGWLWIPGTDWAPAWVSWRSGGDYYGWAPLGPGVNININIPAPYWTFVPQVYFNSPRWYSYSVPRSRVVNIYQNTTIINNYYGSNNRYNYNYGPQRGDIERITRRSVPIYRIDPMDRPGRSVIGNGSVGFYRPGQASGYGQSYGRNDRFDNSSRYDNQGSNGYNRGNYGGNTTPNRDYSGGNTNRPNRDYFGSQNRDYSGTPNRGSYNNGYPADRSGVNPDPAAGTTNTSPSGRFESSRGSYPSGNTQSGGYQRPDVQSVNPSGGYSQQPTRTYERTERQGQVNSSSVPGGRADGGYQRMPEGRGMQNQSRGQEQPQQSNGNRGERSSRGPR